MKTELFLDQTRIDNSDKCGHHFFLIAEKLRKYPKCAFLFGSEKNITQNQEEISL